MPKTQYSAKEIMRKLCEADVLLSKDSLLGYKTHVVFEAKAA